MNQNVFNTSATKEMSMDWKETEITYKFEVVEAKKDSLFHGGASFTF